MALDTTQMNIEDLHTLNTKIWQRHKPRDAPEWSAESCILTAEEWEAIVEAIERLGLVVVPCNACMGFGVGIDLYEQPPVPGIEPLGAIAITQNHLATAKGPDSYERKHGRGTMRLDEAWETFEPLFDTERNRQLMKYHNLGEVQEKDTTSIKIHDYHRLKPGTAEMVKYITGDATQPTSPTAQGNCVIAHVCNDIGKWGKGFVLAISSRWPWIRKEYIAWKSGLPPHPQVVGQTAFRLGGVQLVQVGPNLYVANLIAQHGIRQGSQPPIRYEALQECLDWLGNYAKEHLQNPSIHAPRLGCGLAGGKWETVLPIIENSTITRRGIPFLVYNLTPA